MAGLWWRWPVALLLGLAVGLAVIGAASSQEPGESPPSIDPTPVPGPAAPPLPTHDWRAPGLVAVVGGQLYDPDCWPLRSVGSNLPNMLYRGGLADNLEWMRSHGMRWFRAIVSGHGPLGPSPEAVGGAADRLRQLLGTVEAFNASHDPRESIYVLATLTDYYEAGVPGDRYGYDKPGYCLLRVLNAPWYRHGFRSYDFDQECGNGALTAAPNYEVNYLPWLRRMVAVGAGSRALLGWQLGNELKARNSARNSIAQAYDWYLDWTADVTDTIREVDRAHLIFAGAQHMAELTDWPYRQGRNELQADLVPHWQDSWDRMLRACGRSCWNVWSLTYYDFLAYPVDDAIWLDRAGVAAVMTEVGYTLGTPDEEQQHFGGDRVSALRYGLPRRWQAIDGSWYDRQWGVAELADRVGLQGIAPWGSPDPDPATDPWPDVDTRRGISRVADEEGLWLAWRDAAGWLDAANRRAGPSPDCQAFRS